MHVTASLPLVLLVLALGAGTAQAQSSWKKPSFCDEHDCPIFSVAKKLPNGVELRKYDAGRNRHPLGGATKHIGDSRAAPGFGNSATDLPVPSIAASWASTSYKGMSIDSDMDSSFMVRHAVADLLARLLQGGRSTSAACSLLCKPLSVVLSKGYNEHMPHRRAAWYFLIVEACRPW